MKPAYRVKYALNIRIPGWVRGNAVPGDLYRFEGNDQVKYVVLLNGKPVTYKEVNGYAVLDREWKKGDKVELNLPMEVKRIVSKEDVKSNQDRVALQRGPLVYCVEGADNQGQAWNILLPDNASFETKTYSVLNELVIAIQANVPVATISADGMKVQSEQRNIIAIPYYAWANRGKNQMQIWLPRRIKEVKVNYLVK